MVDKTNALVVERDGELVRRKPGVPLIVHGGSFVSERDVHDPTEVNLPQDATVAALRNAGQQSEANALTIRHRWRHKTENVLSAFSKVRTIGHVRHDDLKSLYRHSRKTRRPRRELVACAPAAGASY